jgi:prophage regulatory protein
MPAALMRSAGEIERRGEFPKRFHLTSRCVVWYPAEIETLIEKRRAATDQMAKAPVPTVRKRRIRRVRAVA